MPDAARRPARGGFENLAMLCPDPNGDLLAPPAIIRDLV
jgi:hypothetical protein